MTVINLQTDWGNNFTQSFRVKNEDGTNKSLVGYTAYMQVRSSYGSEVVVIDASSLNGKLSIDTTESLVTINLTRLDLQLPYNRYVYDIVLVNALGVSFRFIQGEFAVSRQVTRI
jgi:hypothetical protein